MFRYSYIYCKTIVTENSSFTEFERQKPCILKGKKNAFNYIGYISK